MARLSSLLVPTALAVVCLAGFARGDTFVLASGATIDGKVLKEEDGFLWVKTLQKVEKIAAADVRSRTPGESAVERYDKLRAAAEVEPVAVAALWDLYVFQKAHVAELPQGMDKGNARLLQRILKREPDHEAARGELGEVRFEGAWVKKTDLPRLEAERARQKAKRDWEARLQVPVEIHETEHFLLVDNTGEKDLAGRAKALEKAYELLSQALGLESLWPERASIVTIKAHGDYVRALDALAAETRIPPEIVTAAKDVRTGGLWRQLPYPTQLRWPSTGGEGMWSAIVHNVAHIAIWRLWGYEPPPAWIDEGMGEWVEIEVTGRQVATCLGTSARQDERRGATSDDGRRKKDPRRAAAELAGSVDEFKERCKAAVQADEFPPMRKFLKYRKGDLGPPEAGGVLGLVTWLMQTDAEKFRTLVKLLPRRNKRTDDEYWREAYGFELIEDMEKKWRAWVLADW